MDTENEVVGRTEGTSKSHLAGLAGDPVVNWALGAPGIRRLLDPVIRWAMGGGGAQRLLHPLLDRPPYHPQCLCTVRVVVARGERWEVTQTKQTRRGPCEQCIARREIWLWLTREGHPGITVAKLAERVDFASFVRVYSWLKRLVERYPMALPPGGIVLTFRPGDLPTDFSSWREQEHRINLSSDYFGNAVGLLALEGAMASYEQTGENPAACSSPEYLVTHEFAHCMWYRLNTAKYESWWLASDARRICRNAIRNPREGFAEGFSVIRHTPRNEWPPAVRELDAMLKEDGVL